MSTALPPTLEPTDALGPFETRHVRSFDGTRIAYHVTRAPRPGAPVVVLANGLGGSREAFGAQVRYLGDRFRFLTWDYRGLYGSGAPPEERPESYALPNHVRDLDAVLEAEGVRRAALVGWSMGVQVVLESLRTRPDRAESLVLMNGTSGRPLDTLSPVPAVRALVPSLVQLAGRLHAVAAQMARAAKDQPETLAWLKRMGVVGPTLEPAVFEELLRPFGRLDMRAYFLNLRAIGAHDASDLLERVAVPTLVVTGERDTFTPRALAQQMARRIPKAEILVVRGGTHYTAVEYPELVNLRIERFFRAHGFLPA